LIICFFSVDSSIPSAKDVLDAKAALAAALSLSALTLLAAFSSIALTLLAAFSSRMVADFAFAISKAMSSLSCQ